MTKQMIEVDTPERIIFEKSFEKRHAHQGEYILNAGGDILIWSFSHKSDSKYYILTKVEE